jgi:hypothetical protein
MTVNAPNYLAAILRLWQSGAIARGDVVNVDIQHDHWCAYFRDGVCDCRPFVSVRPEAA